MPEAGASVAVPFPEPSSRPRRRGGRHLRAVPAPRRRRSTALPVLAGAGLVLACLLVVTVMHALLIDGQVHLDELERQVASEAEAVERLRLEVAELEAPDRVLEVARDRLGMSEPTEIGYVLPRGAAGADGELLRVPPATVPPPPTTAPPVVQAPTEPSDASSVDAAVAAALASAGIAVEPVGDTSQNDTAGDAEPAGPTPTDTAEDGTTVSSTTAVGG